MFVPSGEAACRCLLCGWSTSRLNYQQASDALYAHLEMTHRVQTAQTGKVS